MNQTKNKKQILFLCNKTLFNYCIRSYVDSFVKYSAHDIVVLSRLGDLPAYIDLDFFDVVVIHYTLYLPGNQYISKQAKERLRNFKGLKIQIIQDENRMINEMTENMKFIGIDVLFTTCLPEEFDVMYPPDRLPGVLKVNALTGYVPEDLLKIKPKSLKDRKIDVGYRTRKLPPWQGRGGYEKWKIGDLFEKVAPEYNIKTDISFNESDRIYGRAWIEFIRNCRAMLGTAGGATIYDFTGDVQKNTQKYLKEHPNATFKEVSLALNYSEIDNANYMVITPRHFEMAALRTAMVMYRDSYSGILIPEQHYIVLERDFSNINEVMQKLHDDDFLNALTQRTYEEVACNTKYWFRSFIEQFDSVVEHECFERNTISANRSLGKFSKMILRIRASHFQTIKRCYYCVKRAIKNPGMSLKDSARLGEL